MWKRIVSSAQWVSSLGVVVMLGGLGLDAQLHAETPDLAAHEGIFTLSNPGHALLAAGIALSVAGTVLFLLQKASTMNRRSRAGQFTYSTAALFIVALALTTFAIAVTGDAH